MVYVSCVGYLVLLCLLVVDGYVLCIDLCGVDYLMYFGWVLFDGVVFEWFEVVLNLINLVGWECLWVCI